MGAQPDGFKWPEDGHLPSSDVEAEADRPLVAYVHVPFCTVRCGYCDFNTYTKGFGEGANLDTYADSVLREIERSAQNLSLAGMPLRPLRSVFIGGGTPSLLDPVQVGRITGALKETFGFAKGAEVTLETNPETATQERMEGFAGAGINRVSMGMQSAVPRVLGVLDRLHTPEKVPGAVQAAAAAGMRVSLDLIYGAPTETLEEWRQSLEAAIALDPEHISAYSLIVEPGTKMANRIGRGELPETDPDLDADKYQMAAEILADAGFHWYEISNFAKNDQARSLHNLAYWRDWDWWGYGPGAHSHIGRLRWWNVKHPRAYAGRLGQGMSPGVAGEQLDAEQRGLEQLMLAIRTREGVGLEDVPSQMGVGRLVEEGLGEVSADGRFTLSLQGRLLADYATRVLAGWES